LSSKNPRQRFEDIVRNIDAITNYTSKLEKVQFLSDQKTIDATERCLGRISEAAIKLGTLAEAMAPKEPWPDIRGFGNWLRHDYDEVTHEPIWKIIQENLPSLREACLAAVTELDRRAKTPAPKKRR
jgi:uncharacterized protein with HEPN domain